MRLHGYGHIPDKPDKRDFLYRNLKPRLGPLPPNVDLRPECSPVRDQGQLGSCSGFAIACGLREFLETRQHIAATSHKYQLGKSFANRYGFLYSELSPLFVYWEERSMEHDVCQDAGGQIRDGMKALANIGCAPEADDPYNISLFKQKPSKQALKDAAAWKVSTYHRVGIDIPEMQTCLASGFGFVMGFTVYESFESDQVARSGIVPMPQPGEQVVGGHAVFVCGYEANQNINGGGCLLIKNSWGTGWGMEGYFEMPYAYVTPDRVSDAWTGAV